MEHPPRIGLKPFIHLHCLHKPSMLDKIDWIKPETEDVMNIHEYPFIFIHQKMWKSRCIHLAQFLRLNEVFEWFLFRFNAWNGSAFRSGPSMVTSWCWRSWTTPKPWSVPTNACGEKWRIRTLGRPNCSPPPPMLRRKLVVESRCWEYVELCLII